MNSPKAGFALPDFDLDYLGSSIIPLLSEYQSGFARMEFGRGLDTYHKRIRAIGLVDNGDLLDAGGGIGNWAIALTGLNDRVEVVDVSAERLFVGRSMAEHMGIKNINFTNMSIERMNFPDHRFDAIVCYSVLMFTDVEKTLAEFSRVLRPGGRLYIQADLWRWYVGQGAPASGRMRYFVKFCLKKILLGKPILLTSKGLQSMVVNAGFKVVSTGQDGESSFLKNTVHVGTNAFYPARAKGREELIELCAIKD